MVETPLQNTCPIERTADTEPEYRLFEIAVSRLVQALDPKAIVRHDVRMPDRHHRRPRQRDVWIEAMICQHYPIAVLVSCKRYKKKLSSQDIDAFNGELVSSGANKGVVYSLRGFTRPAVEKAKVLGIECCRLYQDQPADLPQVLVFQSYCSVPRYHMLTGGDLAAHGFVTWNDVFACRPGDGKKTVVQMLSEEIWRLQQEKTPGRLLYDTMTAYLRLEDLSHALPPVYCGIRCEWQHYRGELQAHRVSGSYSFTTNDFKGSQFGPIFDRLNPPGPGWIPLASQDAGQISTGVCMSILHGVDALAAELLQSVGPQAI